MTTAELQSNPTPELQQFLDFAIEASTSSQSTVRKDFPCDDGVLVVTSTDGGAVEYAVEPLP
jgi:hypothetical protein